MELLPLDPQLLTLNLIWYIHVELMNHLKTKCFWIQTDDVWTTGMYNNEILKGTIHP